MQALGQGIGLVLGMDHSLQGELHAGRVVEFPGQVID